MNETAIGLWIYMNSSDKIIKWLESEKVSTKQQALDRLEPYVGNLVTQTLMTKDNSLAGTFGCVNKVVKYFEEKEKSK